MFFSPWILVFLFYRTKTKHNATFFVISIIFFFGRFHPLASQISKMNWTFEQMHVQVRQTWIFRNCLNVNFFVLYFCNDIPLWSVVLCLCFSMSFSNALILPESTTLCMKAVEGWRGIPQLWARVPRPSGGEMQISGASEWKVQKCIIKNKLCKRDGRAREGRRKGKLQKVMFSIAVIQHDRFIKLATLYWRAGNWLGQQ